jgi:hypothetical protein
VRLVLVTSTTGTARIAERYPAGECKESVGIGGALAVGEREDLSGRVRERTIEVHERLVGEDIAGDDGTRDHAAKGDTAGDDGP